jgi:hypothetical protein
MPTLPLPRQVRLDIELLPPAHLDGTNAEQSFSMLLDAVTDAGHDMVCAGANVGFNVVRYSTPTQLLAHLQEKDPTVIDITVEKTKKQDAGATPEHLAPVMLHRQGDVCRVKITCHCEGAVRWTTTIPYTLDKACVDAPRASTWDAAGMLPLVSHEAIRTERVAFTGAETRMLFGNADGFLIELVARRAVNAATDEPLTVYADRVWALRKFGIVAPRARFFR